MSLNSYNDNDSVFSDDSNGNQSLDNMSIGINRDHTALFNQANKFNKMPRSKIPNTRAQVPNKSMPEFATQFDDLKFSNHGDPVSANSHPNDMSQLHMQRELAIKNGYSTHDGNDLTYGVVGAKNFVHNNMVPWFKSNNGRGYGSDSFQQQKLNEGKQRKVDLFTGSINNPQYRPKTERRPLFNPQIGLTNIYGMPSTTDFRQTRFIPSKERRNELLHQPIRVTPGLNLNYNAVSQQGFHDKFRVLPKTVDELRAANNPKISYGSRVIAGMKGSKRGTLPNLAKRKPVTFYEQDVKDMLPANSYIKGPTVYGNYDAPITKRQQHNIEWYGPVQGEPTKHRPENLREMFRRSSKENYLAPTPRNVTGVDQNKSRTQLQNTHYFKPTMREIHEEKTWLNAPGSSQLNKGVAFDKNTNRPDITKRQLTEDTRYIGMAGSSQLNKGVAFDKNTNRPDITKRQLTEDTRYIGMAGSSQLNKGVAFDKNTNRPDITKRQLTEDTRYIGMAGSSQYNKGVAFDKNTNRPDITKRQLTEDTRYIGMAGSSQLNKGVAFDKNTNRPDITKRQLTEDTRYIGMAGSSQLNKGVAFDMNTNRPDITKRNLTENNTYLGTVGTSQINKGVAFDMNTNRPDITKRNLTENNTYLGTVGTTQINKGIAFDMNTNRPDITKRNLTENNTYLGTAGTSQISKGIAFDMETNIPDPTKRNMTEVNTYLNPAGTSQLEKGGYHAAQAGTYAPTTLRQLTENRTYINPAHMHEGEKTRRRNDIDNSLVNVWRDKINVVRDGGAPTPSNINKGPTFEHTMVQLCEPVQINRELYANRTSQSIRCNPTMYTRIPNQLPQQSNHFYSWVDDNLQNNPYVNNTQHKSVTY